MTPEEHLEIAYRHMVELADDPYQPRLLVEREGDVIAVAVQVDPKDVPYGVPMLMRAFRAHAVIFATDTWIVKDKVPDGYTEEQAMAWGKAYKGLSPSERFRRGDPRATEAMVVQYHTAEGTVHLELAYVRTPTGIVRGEVTKDYTVLSGRAVPDAQAITDAAFLGRLTDELFNEAELPDAVADAVATKYIGEGTGWKMVTFLDVGEADMEKAKAWAQNIGLDIFDPDVEP